MRNKHAGNLLMTALIGGGLYWASKQPGGIKGTWGRFSDKLKEVQTSNDPLGTLKQQFNGAKQELASQNWSQPTNSYEPSVQI